MNSPAPHPSVALALLGRELPATRLRVGLLTCGGAWSRWFSETAGILSAAPGLWVVATTGCLAPARPVLPSGGPLAWYWSRCARYAAAFDQLDLPSPPLAAAAAREMLRGQALDVVLALDGIPDDFDCSDVARFGVWTAAWGDPHGGAGRWPFYAEVALGEPLTSVALLCHSGPTRLLALPVCASDPSFFYTQNAVAPPQALRAALLRCLYDRLMHGDQATAGCASVDVPAQPAERPALLGTLMLLARRAGISLSSQYLNRKTRGGWMSLVRQDPSLFTRERERFTPERFSALPLRAPGYGLADPLPVRHAGQDLVFAEEILPTGRGRLVVYRRGSDQSWLNPPDVILDQPHHLSYPCVFECDGDHFMIPESTDAGRVELWRAEDYPTRWVLDTVYADNVHLVDTTPYFDGERWFFFTASAGNPAELLLFHSRHLRGPWLAHPANPIRSHASGSRMAGQLFRRAGVLIRPGQDCTGAYGRAVRLYAVERLSVDDYAEREVEFIDGSWHPHAERMHTLNASACLEAVDVWRRYRP